MTLFLKDKSESESVQATTTPTICSWKSNLRRSISLVSEIIFISTAIYISNHFGITVFGLILVIPFFLERAASFLPNAEIVERIIHGRITGNLNLESLNSFAILAGLLMILHIYKISDKIQGFLFNHCSMLCRESVLAFIFLLTVTIQLFLICSLLILPCKKLIILIHKISSFKFVRKVDCMIDFVGRYLRGEFYKNPLIVSLIGKIANVHRNLKFLLSVLVVPAFLLDIILALCNYFLRYLAIIIWYTAVIFSQIIALLRKLGKKITDSVESNFISVSFRVSMILALCCTVIINRLEPFFSSPEPSTAIIEFVASVIIIPVILEWIMSYKKAESK